MTKLDLDVSLSQVSLELVKDDKTLIKGNSLGELCNFKIHVFVRIYRFDGKGENDTKQSFY